MTLYSEVRSSAKILSPTELACLISCAINCNLSVYAFVETRYWSRSLFDCVPPIFGEFKLSLKISALITPSSIITGMFALSPSMLMKLISI